MTTLQHRRLREARHPGYLVCRRCDRFVKIGETSPYSKGTPYHVACGRKIYLALSRRRLKALRELADGKRVIQL